MSLETARIDSYVVVMLPPGNINPPTLSELETTICGLVAEGDSRIIIDLSAVSQLNSQVLGLIGTLYREVNEHGGSLAVILGNEEKAETFDMSGLNLIIRVLPDRRAVSSLNEDAREPYGKPRRPADTLTVQTIGRFKVIKLRGKVDAASAARQLGAKVRDLVDAGDKSIALDFTELDYVTSDLLTQVATCYDLLRAGNGKLFIVGDESVHEILSVSGMESLVAVVSSTDELQMLSGHAVKKGPGKTILIVDDSLVMRDLLTRQVTQLGYTVMSATNGTEAVEAARSPEVELVLMDVTMPEMDGYQACKAIKSQLRDRHLPVIFVTNLQEPSERLNALHAGGDDFVNKPVQNEDLLFRIRTHLKLKELMEDLRHMNENLGKIVAEKTNALMETERQLYQAEKLSTIGTMLSGIAHELKNPIFVISSWTEMIRQKGGLSDEQLKGLDFIQTQAVRSASIVENLLKLVRKKVEEVRSLSLNDIIDNIQMNLSYLVTDKSVEVKTDLQARGQTQGNAAEVEQIVVNLVSNAVDAIRGEGLVTIRTRDEGDWCVIEVEDNGCGMTEQVRKRVFDPFYTTKEAGKGTGLGMSILYKIVESHRGRVEIESAPRKGTTVRVYFPRSA